MSRSATDPLELHSAVELGAVGLRDRLQWSCPAPPCHPMHHRPVLDLDDAAEQGPAERDAADLALDAAEQDAAARAAGRR